MVVKYKTRLIDLLTIVEDVVEKAFVHSAFYVLPSLCYNQFHNKVSTAHHLYLKEEVTK